MKRLALDYRVAVTHFRGQFRLAGNARHLFDQVRGDLSRVIRSTGGDDADGLYLQKLARGEIKAPQVGGGLNRIEPSAASALDGLGLFKDLLLHKMGEFAL